jgi:AcrR family transcriptional regulator
MEGKREDRRIRRTKRLLIQALTKLMQQKQVNEITVKELTDLADINRGTFYLYYKDIFDMLEKIENELFGKLEGIIDLREYEGISKQVKPILCDLFTLIEDNQEMCRVLLSPNGDINFLCRLNEVIREKYLQLCQNTKQGITEDDLDYYFSFIIFGWTGIICSWVNRGCPEPARHMADMTIQISSSNIHFAKDAKKEGEYSNGEQNDPCR